MTYVITAKCERAGLCEEVCPTDSIHCVHDDPSWPIYYINPETCIECAACESECPNDAIYHEDDVPEAHVDDIRVNASFFEDGPGKGLV